MPVKEAGPGAGEEGRVDGAVGHGLLFSGARKALERLIS